MCLQEMCMQVVYPGTGNLDIRPVLVVCTMDKVSITTAWVVISY